jgi:hypothetical protein
MGAILQLIRIAGGYLLTASAGWTASDMFNEYQRKEQLQAGKTPTQEVSTSGNFFSWLQSITGVPRWLLWVVVLLGAAYAAKKLFKKK